MDFYAIPQHAIEVFDQLHQLRVTVHDLTGTLWAFLPPQRFRHDIPQCNAVKYSPRGVKCLAFEGVKLQEQLIEQPLGRVHICHAGFVEWVVPVISDDALQMVLFAGIRLPTKQLNVSIRPTRLPVLGQVDVDAVDESESVLIFEHLHQLAARLRQWLAELKAIDLPRKAYNANAAQRRIIIQTFILHRHTQEHVYLAELAKVLGLTESRTSHVVQETFGRSFRQLLLEARLRTAMGLLRHSDMDMRDVASRSGFEDLRHFHRVFKREMNQTPRRYRLLRD
jgi:AraC-like DNA-binding protein